jgi:hypothetical protein
MYAHVRSKQDASSKTKTKKRTCGADNKAIVSVSRDDAFSGN